MMIMLVQNFQFFSMITIRNTGYFMWLVFAARIRYIRTIVYFSYA